ncbi:hypothetical protein RO3G_15027 [Rhizopus delemar RA 99-880]|uniref:Uncharacterized protein n=1 Tax=Rhizopus delemar (strain RA 99-880 / ATCC MYA-4621 / FGSC 9543 / NRRL 43880) TaxID=246409 RepID=I1CPD6_RHIO9|nr:hypothetical protein RO3G_15027 [Rhizopus delemar RA 99-880]|eukprot:EIE90316.1 hypothetical protein RO3G_15027 [Rhizopus delemar RA 99-880]
MSATQSSSISNDDNDSYLPSPPISEHDMQQDKVAEFAKLLDSSHHAHQHRSVHSGRVHKVSFRRNSPGTIYRSVQDQVSPHTPTER